LKGRSGDPVGIKLSFEKRRWGFEEWRQNQRLKEVVKDVWEGGGDRE